MTAAKRGTVWFVGAVIVLLLAAPYAIIDGADAVRGIPGHYEEAAGTVVAGGVDPIILFEDSSGSEVRFEGFSEAEESDSFTVYYDPADPAESAFTPEGRSQSIFIGLMIAAFLGVASACLAGDYVSCSPFRVPIARLAAAQAAIESNAAACAT